MSADRHAELSARLSAEPFVPFEVKTTDERRLRVSERGQAVLNSLALSVVEAPFSVTVVGLDQIEAVTPPAGS